MKISVLINCHDYEEYVAEAIKSVRDQTHPPDELIVVDDGSTDGSVRVIDRAIAGFPAARLVSQANQGQLAAFQRGINESTGDLLFFLDADDTYLPHHIAATLAIMREHPHAGFYFCAHKRSDTGATIHYPRGSGDLGPSALLTYLINAHVGSITSAIVLRREVADAIFPFPDEFFPDWVTRADTCLILGASLTGKKKYFNPEPGFVYRLHGQNNFHGRMRGDYDRYHFYLRQQRMLNHLFDRFNLTPDIARHLHKEFRAVPDPERKVYRDYLKALRLARLSFGEKLVIRMKLLVRYYRPSGPKRDR